LSAHAQTLRVGAGVVIAPDDAEARVQRADPSDSISQIRVPVHAAVYVTSRIGFGVEAMTLGRLTPTLASTMSFKVTDDEQESVIVGTVHARLVGDRRFSLEAAGGIGALRIDRTTRTTFPGGVVPPFVVSDKSNHRAIMAGLDAPFRAARHLTVGPTVRVYWLRRDTQTGSRSSRPSTRLMAGLSAGLAW